jgi:hypothetical protein
VNVVDSTSEDRMISGMIDPPKSRNMRRRRESVDCASIPSARVVLSRWSKIDRGFFRWRERVNSLMVAIILPHAPHRKRFVNDPTVDLTTTLVS